MSDSFRAVIFDLGGVVFPSPFEAFDGYDTRAGLEPGSVRALIRTSSETGAWAALERGELTIDEFATALEAEAESAGFVLDARVLMQTVGGGFGARPAMLHAIDRIRAHGLRTAALTNNWVATDGRASSNGFGELAFDVVVESAVEGVRKPDPRIYELVLRTPRRARRRERLPRRSRHQPQARTRAGDDDDQSDRPRPRAGRARADARLRHPRDELTKGSRRARADHLGQARGAGAGREWQRCAREPAAHRTGTRAGKSVGCVARAGARRRDRVESATARTGDRGADRDRARLGDRDRRRAGGVRRAGRPLHPDGGAARRRRTSAGWRWSKGGGANSAGRTPTRSRPGWRTRWTALVDAHTGHTVVAVCHGGVSTPRSAAVLGLAQPLWFDPGYTSVSRMLASRTGVRSVQSLNETAHLYATREDA